MNNNPKTPTRSTANIHEGQTAADTRPVWKPSKLPLCAFSRKQALADGLQREVPPRYLQFLHAEWDMLLPNRVFLTKMVMETCKVPMRLTRQDEKGRLWEILNVLEVAIGNTPGNRIPFPVSFDIRRKAPLVWLHAVWTTADLDDSTPCVTVKLPQEE